MVSLIFKILYFLKICPIFVGSVNHFCKRYEKITLFGEISTIDKPRISTKHVPLPAHLGDVLHMDIGYGCSAGIGGIKYALFVVDRATRNKYIYGLTSLKHDIMPAIKQLVTDIGRNPGKLVTDYDHKLMGKKITEYLNDINCKIESAPPKHQHQNGLVERNWRSVIRMARSWLNSSLLPSSFWFYAIKRAVEVSNYLPVTLRGQITTPFELAHHVKPNIQIQILLPIFSIAYIDKPSDSNNIRENFANKHHYIFHPMTLDFDLGNSILTGYNGAVMTTK